jgi:enoyl-CoA hydratase/carnithine racemase
MSDRVRTDIVDHVAHVQMVRSDKMNALDGAMFEALVDAGTQLAQADDVRAVVLSGEGRGFCAGIDLTTLADSSGRERAHIDINSRNYNGVNIAQHVVMQWRRLPVPVIAAVQDVAFGGGFQLALGPDMRFVAPKARMSLMEVKWGLIPDMAGMFLLRNLMRPDLLAELLASGRIFDGVEAQRLGIATRVCEDPLADALAFAREIAGKSPDAIRAGKRLLSIRDEEFCTRLLNAEAIEQQALLQAPNQVEAMRAGMAKDTPVFGPAGPAPSY